MAKNNYEYNFEWDWKDLKKNGASTSQQNNNQNNNNNIKPNKVSSPPFIDRNNTLQDLDVDNKNQI